MSLEQRLEDMRRSIEMVKKCVEELEKSYLELKEWCVTKDNTKVYCRFYVKCEDSVNKVNYNI